MSIRSTTEAGSVPVHNPSSSDSPGNARTRPACRARISCLCWSVCSPYGTPVSSQSDQTDPDRVNRRFPTMWVVG